MPFEKGKSGNPAGRKKLPPEVREARQTSFNEMCLNVNEIRNMTVEEAKEIDQKKITLGKRAVLNAYVKFDYKAIQSYEDRLWGKAQEKVDINHSGSAITFNIVERKRKQESEESE